MSVISKFKLSHVVDHGTQKQYHFNAVCADEIPENKRYHKWTPAGKIEITVTNPDVNFEFGKSYYVRFDEADE